MCFFYCQGGEGERRRLILEMGKYYFLVWHTSLNCAARAPRGVYEGNINLVIAERRLRIRICVYIIPCRAYRLNASFAL